jgi:hypothetical protein
LLAALRGRSLLFVQPSVRALGVALVCLLSGRGLARPLALDLDLPTLACPLLFGQAPAVAPGPPTPLGLAPPPVVLQPGPPEGAAPAPGADSLRLKDGRTLQGKILYQVQTGLLFHDALSQQTYVVPFGDIVDVQQGKLTAPPATSVVPDRRLFLEAQIRDVKARYDSLSLWPPIEELIGGVLGVAGGVLFLALLPGDVLDYVLAGLLIIPGGISLVAGTLEMASVVRRENELQDQLDRLKGQLGQLKAEALPAVGPQVVAFRF